MYLVNAIWLREWKKWVNMKLIKKKGKAFAYILDELERDYPGPITNNLLLKDYNK